MLGSLPMSFWLAKFNSNTRSEPDLWGKGICFVKRSNGVTEKMPGCN